MADLKSLFRTSLVCTGIIFCTSLTTLASPGGNCTNFNDKPLIEIQNTEDSMQEMARFEKTGRAQVVPVSLPEPFAKQPMATVHVVKGQIVQFCFGTEKNMSTEAMTIFLRQNVKKIQSLRVEETNTRLGIDIRVGS